MDQLATKVAIFAADFNWNWDWFTGYLPKALAGIGVLIGGWLLAWIISAVVGMVLRKTGIDDRLSESFQEEQANPPAISRTISRVVFWILMLIVLVGVFYVLDLRAVSEPLNAFLNQVLAYAPRILGAALLAILAWFVATAVRFVIRKTLRATNVDEKLARQTEPEAPEEPTTAKGAAKKTAKEDTPEPSSPRRRVALTTTLSETAYWLIWLMFLPLILDTLALPGLLTPVQNLVGQILGFLPNLLLATAILVIGWFVARVIQRIVTNLLVAVGTDDFAKRVDVDKVTGNNRLSDVLGVVVHVLVLIPVIISALNALQVEAITQPASQMLNKMLYALPNIFVAIILISGAVIFGRLIGDLVANLLSRIGFDQLPVKLGLVKKMPGGKSAKNPSDIAGIVTTVAIVLFATMTALRFLNFDAMAAMVEQFIYFTGNVLLGVVIFALGLFAANFAYDLIDSSKLKNSKMIGTVAYAAVLVLAGAMALREMGLAPGIINLAFGLTLGAIAVAAAIAFGIGGRDAARDIIEQYMSSSNGGSSRSKKNNGKGN